jgi:hypothetical protein
MNLGNKVFTVIYIGLIGAIALGVWTHAAGFKTAFGAISSFVLSEMNSLKS